MNTYSDAYVIANHTPNLSDHTLCSVDVVIVDMMYSWDDNPYLQSKTTRDAMLWGFLLDHGVI